MSFPKPDYKSMCDFYGAPGTNQIAMKLPYPMRIAWDLKVSVKTIQCNAKVADSLSKILTEIWVKCERNLSKIQELGLDVFGGCLAVRKMRGGSNWSVHSWGAAIDIDPKNNPLKGTRKTSKIPDWVIDIFEKHGWVSLGRSKGYDWMHFQATAKL